MNNMQFKKKKELRDIYTRYFYTSLFENSNYV